MDNLLTAAAVIAVAFFAGYQLRGVTFRRRRRKYRGF